MTARHAAVRPREIQRAHSSRQALAPRLVTAALLLCLLAAASLPAAALEVDLEYVRHGKPGQGFLPYGYRSLKLATDPPPGDWKLPELNHAHPLYGMVPLGDDERLIVLDASDSETRFYDRLYFDDNGNMDLTDDKVLKSEDKDHGGNQLSAHFPAIHTRVLAGGAPLEYSFSQQTYCFGVGNDQELSPEVITSHLNARLRVRCCYRGKFTLDGQTYHVLLGDANVNGRFDDPCVVPEVPEGMPAFAAMPVEGDALYISSGKDFSYYDGLLIGDLLLLDGTLYESSVDVAAGRLTLTPTTAPLVSVKLAMPVERLLLQSEDASHTIAMFRPGRQAMIPAGSYKVLRYQAYRNDEQGDLWRIGGYASRETPFTEITSSGAALAFGEPFQPGAAPMGFARDDTSGDDVQCQLYFTLRGQAHEFVQDLAHVSGNETEIELTGQRPKEPQFTIFNGKGEKAHTGRFRYG